MGGLFAACWPAWQALLMLEPRLHLLFPWQGFSCRRCLVPPHACAHCSHILPHSFFPLSRPHRTPRHTSTACSTPTDVDTLAFTASPGTATIQVLVMPNAVTGPYGRTNLNVSLILRDSAGNQLATRAGVGIGAFDTNLALPGTYYLSLGSTGAGNPVNNGYSSYGSLGQYQVVLTYFGGSTVGE